MLMDKCTWNKSFVPSIHVHTCRHPQALWGQAIWRELWTSLSRAEPGWAGQEEGYREAGVEPRGSSAAPGWQGGVWCCAKTLCPGGRAATQAGLFLCQLLTHPSTPLPRPLSFLSASAHAQTQLPYTNLSPFSFLTSPAFTSKLKVILAFVGWTIIACIHWCTTQGRGVVWHGFKHHNGGLIWETLLCRHISSVVVSSEYRTFWCRGLA